MFQNSQFTKIQADAISKFVCRITLVSICFGYIMGEIDINHYFFQGKRVNLISERCEHGSCRSLIRLPSGEEVEVSSDRLEFKRVTF